MRSPPRRLLNGRHGNGKLNQILADQRSDAVIPMLTRLDASASSFKGPEGVPVTFGADRVLTLRRDTIDEI